MTLRAALAFVVYVASIVLANVLTDRFGLVPAGFGLMVTAGTYAAGFALVARDLVHRTSGIILALFAVLAGTVLSWILASPALAVASASAFLAAELVDLVVYATALQRFGFERAVLLSSVVAAPIDTFLFLSIAGFPITTETVVGQIVVKVIWATLLPLALWRLINALSGKPIDADDPRRHD